VIAVMSAVKHEISGIKKEIKGLREISAPGCRIWEGKYNYVDILLVQVGIGKQAAETNAEYILKSFPVTIFPG